MPRAKETLRVDVSENTTSETRTITVTITAMAQDFLLSDLLRQRGAVGSIDAPLKQAAREAVQRYLDATEEAVAGIAVNQRKPNCSAKPKARESANGHGAASDVPAPAAAVPNDETEAVLNL